MRSLRARLIVASILWTAGLLLLMHLFSLMMMHFLPMVRGFHSWLAMSVGGGLMVAGFAAARRGLMPFKTLRERLAAVRSGREQHVLGAYPAEIRPLIDDLNGFIDNREKSIQRAHETAGDLAHGLKTPLALLSQEADGLRALGNEESAGLIAQQVDKMTRQVDYHLARARAASSGASNSASTPIAASVGALSRTVLKLYAARNLRIESSIDEGLSARIQREDLDEVLGNVLDNACKWTAARVVVAASVSGGVIALTVDDDGPGLPPSLRTAVLQRGVRADQASPGTGIGLAIVRDIIELYGGTVTLADSPLGGLRVQLTLGSA